MVDHDRDHALEAHIETHLHGHQHDREHDADDGRDQPQPIVKQVPEREFGGERHDVLASSDRSERQYRYDVFATARGSAPTSRAPSGMLRKDSTSAQLSATATANTSAAFTMAGSGAFNSAYCIQTTNG